MNLRPTRMYFSIINKQITQVLGTGTYGSVIKAIDKRTKQKRAIKVIPKSRVTKEERFKTEIEILRNLVKFNIRFFN